jgi:hypothetical protein
MTNRSLTHSETQWQHLIVGRSTKSLLDEAVQTLGTEVETVGIRSGSHDISIHNLQLLSIFLLLLLGETVLGLCDLEFAFTQEGD